MADFTPRTGFLISQGILKTSDGSEKSALLTIADAVFNAMSNTRARDGKVRILAAALESGLGGGMVAERFPEDLLEDVGVAVPA